MKKYSHDQIDKMLQPIMKMMEADYPNNAELIVTSTCAQIKYLHTDVFILQKNLMETISREENSSQPNER